MAKKENIQVPTTDQIEQWKKENGSVFVLEATAKGQTFVAYIRKPKRNEYSYALARMQKDPMEYVGSIMRNCWLGGDEEMKSEPGLLVGIMPQLDDVIGAAEVSLKEL
jgi:hypothetical protein